MLLHPDDDWNAAKHDISSKRNSDPKAAVSEWGA